MSYPPRRATFRVALRRQAGQLLAFRSRRGWKGVTSWLILPDAFVGIESKSIPLRSCNWTLDSGNRRWSSDCRSERVPTVIIVVWLYKLWWAGQRRREDGPGSGLSRYSCLRLGGTPRKYQIKTWSAIDCWHRLKYPSSTWFRLICTLLYRFYWRTAWRIGGGGGWYLLPMIVGVLVSRICWR